MNYRDIEDYDIKTIPYDAEDFDYSRITYLDFNEMRVERKEFLKPLDTIDYPESYEMDDRSMYMMENDLCVPLMYIYAFRHDDAALLYYLMNQCDRQGNILVSFIDLIFGAGMWPEHVADSITDCLGNYFKLSQVDMDKEVFDFHLDVSAIEKVVEQTERLFMDMGGA